MTIQDVLDRVLYLFHDEDMDRIPEATYITFINDAVRQLILARPDVHVQTVAVKLVGGTRQSIPTDGFRLVDITRNMGTAGATPGYAITAVTRSVLDANNVLWHTEDGSTVVYNFSFDPNTPKTFYVTPPASTVTPPYVEMAYSYQFTEMTSTTDTLPVDDIFFMPIVLYTLYLLYSMDDASPTNDVKAQKYEVAFYQALGLEYKAGIMVAPRPDGEAPVTSG